MTPPDSVGPMLLGYAFIFGTGIFYVVTLALRRRGALRDLLAIRTVERDN